MFTPQRGIVICTLACMMAIPSEARARKHVSKAEIAGAIQRVQQSTDATVREDASEQVAKLTRSVNPGDVDDRMIADLILLLDRREGRLWIAVSLGNIGKRASAAIPKLQDLLPAEECSRVHKSAADEIRYALNRMGVFPPPSRCQ